MIWLCSQSTETQVPEKNEKHHWIKPGLAFCWMRLGAGKDNEIESAGTMRISKAVVAALMCRRGSDAVALGRS